MRVHLKEEVSTIKADGSCYINGDKADSVTKKADNIYKLIFKFHSGQGKYDLINMDITFTTQNTGTVSGISKENSFRRNSCQYS